MTNGNKSVEKSNSVVVAVSVWSFLVSLLCKIAHSTENHTELNWTNFRTSVIYLVLKSNFFMLILGLE